jgi:hypothetical protein
MTPEDQLKVQALFLDGALKLLREASMGVAIHTPPGKWRGDFLRKAARIDALYAYMQGEISEGELQAQSGLHSDIEGRGEVRVRVQSLMRVLTELQSLNLQHGNGNSGQAATTEATS